MRDEFKLLKGHYRSEIITSELNPLLIIRLVMLCGGMLKVEITYHNELYVKVIRMISGFNDYVYYSHYVMSNFNDLVISEGNNIINAINTIMVQYGYDYT
jgi:hypothetical protein